MKKLATNVKRSKSDVLPPPAHLSVQPDNGLAVQTGGRRTMTRLNGAVVRKKTWHIPEDLCVALEVHAAQQRSDQQDVVIAALKRMLGRE